MTQPIVSNRTNPSKLVPRRLSRNVLYILFWCLGIGVLAPNFLWVRQHRQMRTAGFPALEAGCPVDDLVAAATDGVLITLSPSCPICKSNQPKWNVITKALEGRGGWRVVWVSRDKVDPTRQYGTENSIDAGRLLADPVHRTYTQLALDKVPQTIVLGQGGTVEKVWRGKLDNRAEEEVTSYIRTHSLPSPGLGGSE